MNRTIRWMLPLLVLSLLGFGCAAGTLSVGGDDDDATGDDDDASGDDDDATGDDDDAPGADDDDDDASGDDDDDDTGDDDTGDDDDDDDASGDYEGEIYVVIHSWWDIEGFGDATATVETGALVGEGIVSVDLGDEVVDAPVTIEGSVSGDYVAGNVNVELSSLTEWLPDLPMEMEGEVENDGTLMCTLFADMGWLGSAEGLLELVPQL